MMLHTVPILESSWDYYILNDTGKRLLEDARWGWGLGMMIANCDVSTYHLRMV